MMEESPLKHKPTSKVIDSLHSQIDSLKNELEAVKLSHDDYKKKYSIASKKNESFVDQLANAKHENDMINALLKRKERRISDLENQYNELSSTNESLQLNNKNMKIRCESLQESSASSIAEFERLKIAYDALIASQNEYKKHYQKELNNLTSQFEEYKKQSLNNFENLQSKLASNDKDVDVLLDSLTSKRKTMDNLYVNKNKLVIELLSKLAQFSKIHGQDTKNILQNNVSIINELITKYPDLSLNITKSEKIDLDLDEILNDTNETLSNSSFDEEATLINSPDPQQTDDKLANNVQLHRNMSQKKRKNKRNSIRFDSRNTDFHSLSNSIQNNNSTQLNVSKRNSSNHNHDLNARTPTPPEEMFRQNFNSNFGSNQNQIQYNNNNNYNQHHNTSHSRQNSAGFNNFNNSNNNNNNYGQRFRNPSSNNNRSKRRSMYGNNNYTNNFRGGHSRQNSQQMDTLPLNT